LSLAVKSPAAVFSAVGVDGFTGRDWLLAEVDQFIAASPCGYVLVEADAGMGKTALAAWLVKSRNYVSHFSRYSDGWRVQTALQNLSAQLIQIAGLTEQAPGGLLPQWAQTPTGFESLLSLAASAVTGRLVIVVDGLDEAEASGDRFPFGLPTLLPDGVFVIGTYRTGFSVPRPECPVLDVRINKDDARNQADIIAYLLRAAADDPLAARLAEAGLEAAEFVALLARKCGGIWVYLRYVLEELRLGLRRPDAISMLPPGLREYYAAQVRRWHDDPNWEDELLPLLATLGVAGKPLTVQVLARFAGDIRAAAVRRRCDRVFRPLLTTSNLDSGSPRYEVYHRSFRDFLQGLDDEAQQGDGHPARPYDLLALTGELRQASIAAHCRAADTYLRAFGGLDDELPLLAAEPSLAQADDRYPLAHLVGHLHRASRTEDMHRLLRAERQTGTGPAINVWFSAHDHADTLSRYLDDLAYARSITPARTEPQAAGASSPALALDIRYSMMAASIASRVQEIPRSLLEKLIDTGTWSTIRGTDQARRFTDPADRARALLVIHRYAAAGDQPAIIDEAIAAATSISDEESRAKVLASLSPYLPREQIPGLLATVIEFHGPFERAQAIAELAPNLPPELLDEALNAAIDDAFVYSLAVEALAPHLPVHLLAKTQVVTNDPFDITHSIHYPEYLAALAPYLPPELLAHAIDNAVSIDHEPSRAKALTVLVPFLSGDQRGRILPATVSAIVAGNKSDAELAEMLGKVTPYISAEQSPGVLTQTLEAAVTLSPGMLRSSLVGELAQYLPDKKRLSILAAEFEVATAMPEDLMRASALAALAPYLPAEFRTPEIDDMVAFYDQVAHGFAEAQAEIELLEPELLHELAAATAIADVRERAEALTVLALHLPAGSRSNALIQALALAKAIPDGLKRIQTLTLLLPHLPADMRNSVLAEALADAMASPYRRDETLVTLLPHLTPDARKIAVPQALADVLTKDVPSYSRAWNRLVPYLLDEQLAQVLTATITKNSRSGLPRALGDLAPHLPPALMPQALAAMANIRSERDQAVVLRILAPYLPKDLLPQALSLAEAMPDAEYRAVALGGLVPHLPDELLSRLTSSAPEVPLAPLLVGLAPRLPADLLKGVLEAAPAVYDEYFRLNVLTAIAPHLPAELMHTALTVAMAMTDSQPRAKALADLAPYLPADLVPEALSAALSRDYNSTGLAALAPYLPAALLPQALAAAESHSVALAGLAPYLPADLMPEAIAAAAAITSDMDRGSALVGLAPFLPASLLPQALALVPQGDTRARVALMERAQATLAPFTEATLIDLFRRCVNGQNRQVCLEVITAIAETIASIGGPKAISECITGLDDACRWWP
jgi:hypothetical protein